MSSINMYVLPCVNQSHSTIKTSGIILCTYMLFCVCFYPEGNGLSCVLNISLYL